jgi:transposase
MRQMLVCMDEGTHPTALDTRTGVSREPPRRLELLSGAAGRRRSWSLEQKLAIVAEAEDCDSLTALARRHDIRTSQLYTWRRELRYALAARRAVIEPDAAFVPVSPTARRRRGIDENGEVTNLFQGEAPVHPKERRGEVYPGDRAIRDADNVTIQIHTLSLTRDDQVVVENVPVLAVWVPARLARAWIAQDEQ